MLKVLHYYHYPPTARKGGPATYIYNIKKFVESNKNDVNIEFSFLSLPFLNSKKRDENGKSLYESIKNILGIITKNLKVLKYCISLIRKSNLYFEISKEFSKYDIIHLHDTFELVQLLPFIKKNRTYKIVLTTHCPKARHLEFIEDNANLKASQLFYPLLKWLESLEKKGLNSADYVMWPCEEALEPYFNTWKGFSSVSKKLNSIYCPTGVPKIKDNRRFNHIRRELNISDSSRIICFSGRQIAVKGFDIFVDFSKKLLEEFDDIFILVLGSAGKFETPINKRWINIGWTDKPYDYIKVSDIVVIPNRETYFDLNFLEILALGKCILASDKGGNSYFKNYFSQITNGIEYFDINKYDSFLNGVKKLSKNKRKKEEEQLNLFNSNFTIEKMIFRLENIYHNIAK